MGFCLYDVNGYVGDVGTAQGWDDLCAYLATSGSKMGRELARRGFTVAGNDLFDLEPPQQEDVRSTFENLRELAKKCSELLIVSDGEEPE